MSTQHERDIALVKTADQSVLRWTVVVVVSIVLVGLTFLLGNGSLIELFLLAIPYFGLKRARSQRDAILSHAAGHLDNPDGN